MSTSYKVFAVIGGDEHRKKAAAYIACEEAGVKVPQELIKYFGDNTPSPDGMEIELDIEWETSHCGGHAEKVVDLAALPEGTYKLKFKTS